MKQQVITRKEALKGIKFAQDRYRWYGGRVRFGWMRPEDLLKKSTQEQMNEHMAGVVLDIAKRTLPKISVDLTEQDVRQIIKNTPKDDSILNSVYASPEYWEEFDRVVKQQYLK